MVKEKKTRITQQTIIQEYHLTKRMIEKYFPEPIRRKNLDHPGGADLKLWEKETVDRIVRSEEIQVELQKLEKRRRRKREKDNEINEYLSTFNIDHLISRGSVISRKFYLHVGETNSGKTYEALKRLKNSKSGIYLAPLRLMALEIYSTLNEEGYLCSMITGEEERLKDGARYTSSTIEMCNYSTRYEVAIIDEAQMIADKKRGSAWTKAICLINAAEIHICMAPEALDIITRLLGMLGAEYTVIKHERMTPLEFKGGLKLSNIQPKDCVVAFSRKVVLNLAAEFEKKGITCSVIYGSLPPEARKEEVRKFIDGETQIVVATDAIGMGLSLPIRRIIFSEINKFDGENRRRLSVSEIKQIAGRAGRFGLYKSGEVYSVEDPGYVRKALKQKTPDIGVITYGFPENALKTDYSLSSLIKYWNRIPENEIFRKCDLSDAEFLLTILKNTNGTEKQLLFDLVTCPVDTKKDMLVFYWLTCAKKIISGDRDLPEPRFGDNSLEQCELQYAAWDIYHYMQGVLGAKEILSVPEKDRICRKISNFLKSKSHFVKRCRLCGKILPARWKYGLCEECYNSKCCYDYDSEYCISNIA